MQTGMTEKNQAKSLMSINKVVCPQNISSSIKKRKIYAQCGRILCEGCFSEGVA